MADFRKVTRFDGEAVWLNFDHVFEIKPNDDDGSSIHYKFCDEGWLQLQESPAELNGDRVKKTRESGTEGQESRFYKSRRVRRFA